MDAHVERVSELTKLARLIGEIRFGLLTTIAEDGSLWSRPISTQRASPEGEVWFFVKDDAPIAKELRRHSRVSICYAKPIDGSYVSISGNCELFSDRAKASELWDTTFQEWLPGGPDDPSLVVARVTVERADYWDTAPPRPGRSRRDSRYWLRTSATIRSTMPRSTWGIGPLPS